MNKNLQAYPKEEVTALKRMYWRSNFLESCFNMVRLQGLGFGYAMIPFASGSSTAPNPFSTMNNGS